MSSIDIELSDLEFDSSLSDSKDLEKINKKKGESPKREENEVRVENYDKDK